MLTDTVVLTGTLIIEGVAFNWSVTDKQRLAVSHDRLGKRTEQLVGKPQAQARDMARALLAGKVSIPDVDATE